MVEATHVIRRGELAELWFPRDDTRHPQGLYDVRAGIAWPAPSPAGGVIGHVVVFGMQVPTRRYYWFAETQWSSVDHVVDGQQVVSDGVAPWIATVWQRFGVATWYATGNRELGWHYRQQMAESPALPAKPGIQDMEWDRPEHPWGILQALLVRQRLEVPASTPGGESQLVATAQQYAVLPPGTELPPLIAAACAVLVAMETYPVPVEQRGGVVWSS